MKIDYTTPAMAGLERLRDELAFEMLEDDHPTKAKVKRMQEASARVDALRASMLEALQKAKAAFDDLATALLKVKELEAALNETAAESGPTPDKCSPSRDLARALSARLTEAFDGNPA